MATRSIEDEILAGGKLVPNPLAGQGGTVSEAIAEKQTRLNPERPMVDGRHVAGEAVSAQARRTVFHIYVAGTVFHIYVDTFD